MSQLNKKWFLSDKKLAIYILKGYKLETYAELYHSYIQRLRKHYDRDATNELNKGVYKLFNRNNKLYILNYRDLEEDLKSN